MPDIELTVARSKQVIVVDVGTGEVSWAGVRHKPETFPPAAHTHTNDHAHPNKANLDKITEDGSGLPLWDGATWPGGGSGGSGGPVTWNDVSGKPATFAPSAHQHPVSEVTSLQTALDGKAAGDHTHADLHTHANKDTIDLLGKDGNGAPTWDGAAWPGASGGGTVAWTDVTGKPSSFPPTPAFNQSALDNVSADPIVGAPLWGGGPWPSATDAVTQDYSATPSTPYVVTGTNRIAQLVYFHSLYGQVSKVALQVGRLSEMSGMDALLVSLVGDNAGAPDEGVVYGSTIVGYDLLPVDPAWVNIPIGSGGVVPGTCGWLIVSVDGGAPAQFSVGTNARAGNGTLVGDPLTPVADYDLAVRMWQNPGVIWGDVVGRPPISRDSDTGAPMWEGAPWPGGTGGGSADWSAITNKPSTFTPSAHAHGIGDIPVAASGTSSTTKLVRADDSRLSDTRTPTAHSHATSEVTGLDTALTGKADTTHAHAVSDTTGLQTALDGKAASDHTHTDLHAHTNKAALDKITESGGAPLWNGSAWPGGGGASTLVAEVEVGSPVSQLDITGLDNNAGGGFIVEFELVQSSGSTSDMSIYPNGLTGATYVGSYTGYGASAVAGNVLSSPSLAKIENNGKAFGVLELTLFPAGNFYAIVHYHRWQTSDSAMYVSGWHSTNAAESNFTSLTLKSSVANGIGTGSAVRVYKR